MTTIAKVISGGQSGADMGGLLASKEIGIPTGGVAPKGWLTEYGPAPSLAAEFGLIECPEPGYPPRTEANVRQASGVVWFGNPYSPGGRLTIGLCKTHAVDHYIVISRGSSPKDVADWIHEQLIEGTDEPVVLMVAGNRESGSPGMAVYVEKFMGEVFNYLGDDS